MDERLIILLLASALFLVLRVWQQHRKRQAQFQRRAQDQGLKPVQRRLLWKLARQQGRNPVLLRSASAFELCVGECVRSGEKRNVLAELARIRVLLGFDQLQPGQPLHTTRQLAQGQILSLWPSVEGTDQARDCLVVAKDEQILVTAPLAGTVPAWPPGTPLHASFQRAQEVQYRFTTRLLERTPHSLSLKHAEQMERLQARSSCAGTPPSPSPC